MIRKLCMAGLFTLAGAMLLYSQTPSLATAKKDEVAKLKKTIADRDAQIKSLLATASQKDTTISTLQQANTQLTADLKTAKTANTDYAKDNESLRKNVKALEKIKKAPFIHAAILKLKKDDDAQIKKITDEAAKTLAKIDGVRGFWIGKPAEMGTPELAQKGYHLGVIVLLDDADALQKFLDDSLHKQFTDKLADKWERPVVYDIQRDLGDAKKKDPKE